MFKTIKRLKEIKEEQLLLEKIRTGFTEEIYTQLKQINKKLKC